MTFWASVWNFVAGLGALFIGGSVFIGLAYWLFKLLGEKWLSAKFDERLASFKHVQEKELEEFRFKFNALFDRKTKLHQREFEIIPRVWSLLVDAHATVAAFVSAFQQYADVKRMAPQQLEEFLEGTSLANWQKAELRASGDKNKYFQKAIFWQRYSECRSKCRELHVYLLQHGVFLSPVLKEKFSKLDGIIWGTIVEHQINEEHDIRPRQREAQKQFEGEGAELLASIESDIRKVLWSQD